MAGASDKRHGGLYANGTCGHSLLPKGGEEAMKGGLFAAALGLALAAVPATAQDPDAAQAQDNWQAPRTAWGDPDLRGMWPVDYLGQTPRQRPEAMGERAQLTDAEYEAALARARAQQDWYGREEEAGMMAMGHWIERGLPLRQTSLITQPANGRYPELTEYGEQLRAGERTSWNTEVFSSMDDFGIFDRCLTRGMPGSMLPGNYNGGIRVMQSPGLLAIQLEMIHETRLVYLDGRAPPPASMQFDLGYSTGHWEGETLVIETTNFRPGMSAGPAPNSAQMRVVEHLTPTGPDNIRYQAWITDPAVMTTGYKLDFPWERNPDYEIFEYACHEGNVQVRGYITATSPRFAAERAQAWERREKENEE